MPWLRKKPWDKVVCNFELQEYGGGQRGWVTVTEPTGEPPTIAMARELFKPGYHYRVMARAVEERAGFKGGTFVGVVWTHYEPLPGGVEKIKETAKIKEKTSKLMEPEEMMGAYMDKVERVLEPIAKFGEIFGRIRESFGVGGTPPPSGGESAQYTIPPLEFDGKAPWFMHPSVMHSIAEEMKGVIAYAGDRFEQAIGGRKAEAPIVEEEEFVFPSLPGLPSEEEVEEEEAPEEEVEEELMPPSEEAIEEAEKLPEIPAEEVPTEETVPSLIEEERVCASCGKAGPLLPNGLCQKCAKKLAKEVA